MPKPEPKLPVVIDTREQAPWQFDADLFSPVVSGLRTGDYSVMGLEDRVCVERKTLGDAVNTVVHQWRRFLRELQRLAGMDQSVLVVESSVEAILLRQYESDAEPLAVLGRLNSVMIDHNLPVVFAGSRAAAEVFAARWLIQAARKVGGV